MDPDGEPTRAFLVSELLRGASSTELSTVERGLRVACSRLSEAGTPVRLLATAYLPAQHRWLGLLLADDDSAAHRAAAIAQLVMFQVVEV